METRERFARHAWALSFLGACAPLPSELEGEGPCAPQPEPIPGVVVARASDEFTRCSSCEPGCFHACDRLRSWDVAVRGGDGLVLNPATGGGENRAHIVPCTEAPCEVAYGTGAIYTRSYEGQVESCSPGSVLWAQWGWTASIPEGTRITFEFRGSAAPLPDAEAVSVDVDATTTRVPDISHLFQLAGLPPEPPSLQVRAILHASEDRRTTPTLYSFCVEHYCHLE